MKVFNFGSEWVAAQSLEDAKKFFIDGFAADNLEADETKEICDSAREITEEEMDRLKHCGDDGEDYENPRSFREELKRNIESGVEFPCIFASADN